MYALYINNDNTMQTLINQSIYQDYKLSDWFWILSEVYYDSKKMYEYDAEIKFTLPSSQKEITEKLTLKNDLYNGYLKYVISSKSKLTSEAGVVKAKVIFKDGSESVVRETEEFTVHISTVEDFHNDGGSVSGSGTGSDSDHGSSGDGGGCDCDSEEHIEEILSRIKPLVFSSTSEAETKLNSGDVKDIYYGQTVLIVGENGKYVSYTVQKGESDNKYIVEPVDTFGDGAIWEEQN